MLNMEMPNMGKGGRLQMTFMAVVKEDMKSDDPLFPASAEEHLKNLLLSLHSRCHVAHCVSLFGFLNCCRTEYREWGCLLPCRTLCFFLCCREGMLKRPLSFVLFSVTHTPCWLFVMMQCLSLCCKWIGYFFLFTSP